MFQILPQNWKEIRALLAKMTDNKINWSSFYSLWREIDKKVGGDELHRDQQKVCEKHHNVNIFIASLALNSESVFSKKEWEFSRSGEPYIISFTKEQIACLNALMFFSIYPDLPEKSESYPKYRNFNTWRNRMLEQWKCLYNYFETLEKSFEEYKTLDVTYIRVSWLEGLKTALEASKDLPLTKYRLDDSRGIEELKDCLQIDFANKFIGGGITAKGSAQEEIRFAISPELIPSLLLFEKMDHKDAIIIIGAEQYSNYSGYGRSFKFLGPHKDQAETVDNTKLVVVVAIDALNFSYDPSTQYVRDHMDREILKAFTGFNWWKILESYFFEDLNKQSKGVESDKIIKEVFFEESNEKIVDTKQSKAEKPDFQSRMAFEKEKSALQDSKITKSSKIYDEEEETKSRFTEEVPKNRPNDSQWGIPIKKKSTSTIRSGGVPQGSFKEMNSVSASANLQRKSRGNEKNSQSHTKNNQGTNLENKNQDINPQSKSKKTENEQQIRESKSEKTGENLPYVKLKFWEKKRLHTAIEKMGLATGKWGCGIYKGNEELKFLIQLLSASMSCKDMVFCTFSDKDFFVLSNSLEMLREKPGQKLMTCKELYLLLVEIIENLKKNENSLAKGIVFKLFKGAYTRKFDKNR